MEGHQHRVLLVDDQALIGKIVERFLASSPDIIFEFRRDAVSAIEAAATFRPTVILQDLVMPDVEGLEMVRRFRDLPATADVPVLVLSSQEEPATKARLFAGGAADYLVKPPEEVELIARLKVHSEAYHRLVERNEAFAALEQSLVDLGHEREKSERLLRAILPAPIAERLKEGAGTIAEAFPAVSVLFADLAGFTAFSRDADPRGIVELLDEVFSAFDHLAIEAGVEKIKTIGDAYMAVAGVPEPRTDHADAIARMALAMEATFQQLARDRAIPLGLRIGIHSGPVVAGVIGHQKFSYDLWGDTVNVASRLESHGLPGRIHVSAQTRNLLGDRYRFEDLGTVALKGKGLVSTHFLLGPA
jgi:adenylate cyclase